MEVRFEFLHTGHDDGTIIGGDSLVLFEMMLVAIVLAGRIAVCDRRRKNFPRENIGYA